MRRRTFRLDRFRTLNVIDDKQHDVDSADNVNSYDCTHLIPSRVQHVYLSNRGITLQLADGTVQSLLVRFPDGGRLSDSNVLATSDRLYMAGGANVCCIDTRTLDLLWSGELLTGADNGLLVPANDNCIIAIGDYDASCIEHDGKIRWATKTNAVLCPQATIDSNSVLVFDENGLLHAFDIATGKVTPPI